MARADAGLTISELAERAGVSRDTISNAEKGRHGLQTHTLHKIAQALGKAPSELLAEEERLAPKAGSRSSLEPTLWNGLEEERHEYPYPWMAGSLARAIEDWRYTVEDPSKRQGFAKDPAYIRGISVACFDIIASIVLIERDTLASGEAWARLSEDEKHERLGVAKQLDALAREALTQYRASEAAQEAEVIEIERRREEIRRWTRELSA